MPCSPNYTLPTKKNVRFEWDLKQQVAWEKLRETLDSEQVMAHPHLNDPYKLYTDASHYAIGAVLVQDDD